MKAFIEEICNLRKLPVILSDYSGKNMAQCEGTETPKIDKLNLKQVSFKILKHCTDLFEDFYDRLRMFMTFVMIMMTFVRFLMTF